MTAGPEASARRVQDLAMIVLVYVNTIKQVGDAEHVKVFAATDAAEAWFEENDLEGVAFGYEVLESIPKEALMRILALAILTIWLVSIGPAAAQTYDPAYPVCLHVYSRGANYYQCSYTSLPQCNASASGRAAQCVINPYFAGAQEPAGYRRHRRVY
jgi:hypothetical protein